MNIESKFKLDEFVKFSNGFEICIGYILEIRIKRDGIFYFIKCFGDVCYEIQEDAISSLDK